MRGAPHNGFSALICRINARRSAAILGRPRRFGHVINKDEVFGTHNGIRLELHWDEPRLDAFEFVSRKLPQNAVLYDVLGLHMPASVAPSAGQRPRHGNRTRRIAPAAETYTRQLCTFFVLY